MSKQAADKRGTSATPRGAAWALRATPRRLSKRAWGVVTGLAVFSLAFVLPGARAAPARTLRTSGSLVAHPMIPRLTLNGTAANNTFEIRATGPDSGTYAVNDSRPVHFSGIRSLTMNGVGGHDVCRIINPHKSLFAPPGGIFCNGRNAPGHPRRGVLEVAGGTATGGDYTVVAPGAGTLTHSFGHLIQSIHFTGLAPVTDTTSETNFTINANPASGASISLVNGPVVSSAQTLEVTSSDPSYESVTFANKTNVIMNAQNSNDTVLLANSVVSAGLNALQVNATSSGGDVQPAQSNLSGVAVTLDSAGSISGSGSGVNITATSLEMTAGANIFLYTSIGTVAASATGDINMANTGSDLTVGQLTSVDSTPLSGIAAQDATIVADTGNLILNYPVTISGGSDSTFWAGARNGEVTQAAAGTITALNMVAWASSGISLGAAPNQMDTFGGDVSGSSGASVLAASPLSGGSKVTIGQYPASTFPGPNGLFPAVSGDSGPGDGTLDIDGYLDLGVLNYADGTVYVEAKGLSADSSGSISCNTLKVTDAGTGPFTLNSTTFGDGTGTAVPYSASTFDLFMNGMLDLEPSPNTAVNVTGDGSIPSTVNYNAGGGQPVETTTGPSSGVVNMSGVKPFTFDNFTVNLINEGPASSGSSGPSSGGGPPPPRPTPAAPGPCKCAKVVAVLKHFHTFGDDSTRVEFDVHWKMSCTAGAGNCKGEVKVLAPKGATFVMQDGRTLRPAKPVIVTVRCSGPCEDDTTGSETVQYLALETVRDRNGHKHTVPRPEFTPKGRAGKTMLIKLSLICLTNGVPGPGKIVLVHVKFDKHGQVAYAY